MCYSLYLSTSSREDLTQYNSPLLRFGRPDATDEKWTSLLRNEHKWFVGSESRCSCAFRHFSAADLGFIEPQEWCPEDKDNVQATAELYRVIHPLIDAGEQVDCLDAWSGATREDIREMRVSLGAVSERQFLLFENHHLILER